MAELKEVRLNVELAEGLLAQGDPRQVRTALHCLVRNAIEAAPSDGWVRIHGSQTESETCIAVEDSGPGIDSAMIDSIFDPFYSGRPAGRGRGLGLPTAWRLAREQGGAVRYVTQDNGPTRFELSLPRANDLPTQERLSA